MCRILDITAPPAPPSLSIHMEAAVDVVKVGADDGETASLTTEPQNSDDDLNYYIPRVEPELTPSQAELQERKKEIALGIK